LLEDPARGATTVSRRHLLRRLALAGTAAAALPIIRSIVVPSAAHAASAMTCAGDTCPSGYFCGSQGACRQNRFRDQGDCISANSNCAFGSYCNASSSGTCVPFGS
jgi:hypothetical protein